MDSQGVVMSRSVLSWRGRNPSQFDQNRWLKCNDINNNYSSENWTVSQYVQLLILWLNLACKKEEHHNLDAKLDCTNNREEWNNLNLIFISLHTNSVHILSLTLQRCNSISATFINRKWFSRITWYNMKFYFIEHF